MANLARVSGLRPGDVVDGRFEVEREAGQGGMGIVYRAIDRRDGSTIALKVLRAHAGQAARFAREAELLAELRHPAIIRYVAEVPENPVGTVGLFLCFPEHDRPTGDD